MPSLETNPLNSGPSDIIRNLEVVNKIKNGSHSVIKKLNFSLECTAVGLKFHVNIMFSGYAYLINKIEMQKIIEESHNFLKSTLENINSLLKEKENKNNKTERYLFEKEKEVIKDKIENCIKDLENKNTKDNILIKKLQLVKREIENKENVYTEEVLTKIKSDIEFYERMQNNYVNLSNLNELNYLTMFKTLLFASAVSTSVGLLGVFTIPTIAIYYAVSNYKNSNIDYNSSDIPPSSEHLNEM